MTSLRQLKASLRNQLQAKGIAGARQHGRDEEMPFERPWYIWKELDPSTYRLWDQALAQLLGEVPTKGWNLISVEQLTFLVERAPSPAPLPVLELIVRQDKWGMAFARTDPDQALMLALRTFHALGGRLSSTYWVDLPLAFRQTYPALIFSGLADHSLSHAFRTVHQLLYGLDDPKALAVIKDIAGLFPYLVETLGHATVSTALMPAIPTLPVHLATFLTAALDRKHMAGPDPIQLVLGAQIGVWPVHDYNICTHDPALPPGHRVLLRSSQDPRFPVWTEALVDRKKGKLLIFKL